MKLNWAAVGLVALGIVAALCAAVLVATLRSRVTDAQNGPVAQADVEVLVAAKDIPIKAVIDAGSFTMRKVALKQAPRDYLSDPVQVTGKVLCVPMVSGQAFTRTCFAPAGSGLEIASILPKGMRAVSISLSNYSGLEGLLYPGSIVDILVSLKLPGTDGDQTQAVSTPLLQNIQVLGVEGRTILSPDGTGGSSERTSRQKTITLMVDLKQAEALQLAMQHGSISLAMRNPLDVAHIKPDLTLLQDISPELARWASQPGPEPSPVQAAGAAGKTNGDEATKGAGAGKEDQPPAKPGFVITILRGGATQTRKFPVPGEESETKNRPSR